MKAILIHAQKQGHRAIKYCKSDVLSQRKGTLVASEEKGVNRAY